MKLLTVDKLTPVFLAMYLFGKPDSWRPMIKPLISGFTATPRPALTITEKED